MLAPIIQPFVIHRGHEGEEPLEGLALDAVSTGIPIQSSETDRELAAEGKILPVALQEIPGTEVKCVPGFELGLRRRLFNEFL
ncbi:hypothetical protein MAUB1S_11468 [Mycolicibacterium aubagnense]